MTHIIEVDDDPIVIGGKEYRGDYYEETNRRVGSQQEVANWWAQGKVPCKEVKDDYTGNTDVKRTLVSGTRNFKGIHKPNGSGYLKHYSVTEAIRTKNLHIISNTQCYARGFAHCSTPSRGKVPRGKTSLPLSDWANLIEETYYDIVDVTRFGERNHLFRGKYDRIVHVWVPDENRDVHVLASSSTIREEPATQDELDEISHEFGGA